MNFRNLLVVLVLVFIVGALFTFLWLQGEDGQSSRSLTIGILHPSKVDKTTFEGFKTGMLEQGYQEGVDIIYLYDGPTGKGDALNKAAQGMVKAGVDLIFASSTPATVAAKKATAGTVIPVIFGPVNDPLAAGVVTSIKEPGGNVTGIRLPASGGKRMQMLSQILSETRVVVFPLTKGARSSLASLEQAREGIKGTEISIITRDVESPQDIESLLANIPADADAIFLPRGAFITAQIDKFVAAAISHRLILSSPGLIQVEAGALFSYGFEHFEVGRHAAELAHKVISGAQPENTPVETARSYLFINLATADAIGVDISNSVLKQAKKIIR